MKVGFIGVGNMGKGMASHVLRSSSVASLSVFDVSNINIENFVGGESTKDLTKLTIPTSVAELASQCNFVCLSLPDENITSNVILNEGLLDRMDRANRPTIIDHGSFTKNFAVEMSKLIASDGVTYVDAPVSGGPMGAKLGTLSIMLGGSHEDIVKATPLLQLYSKNLFHFGEVGNGMAAKLINQALVGMHAQAACEALALADKLQLRDTKLLADMLQVSWGQSRIQELVCKDYIVAQEEGWAPLGNSAAPLRNMVKDFANIMDASEGKLPLVTHTNAAIKEACDKGLASSAFASLIKLLKL